MLYGRGRLMQGSDARRVSATAAGRAGPMPPPPVRQGPAAADHRPVRTPTT